MKRRLVLVALFLGAWTAAAAARLYQLQVADHALYERKAAEQQEEEMLLEPPRGSIFDCRGRPLAMSVEVDSAWANPGEVADPAAAAARLARVLGVDRRALEKRLSEEDRHFVWVARQLDDRRAEAVRALDLEGISFVRESKRYYPMGLLAAQLLGFVGIDHVGLDGLEQAFDRLVAGIPARRRVLRRPSGPVLTAVPPFDEPTPGSDLHLTLDAVIQEALERHLTAALDRHRAKGAFGVVLDPSSGAIRAIATVPAFHPARFGDYPRETWRNRPVTDAFEPGSTFKIVTMARALEDNLLDPTDQLDCQNGTITVDGVTIRDHKPFGLLTASEVISRSSNVCAIKIGLEVGPRGLYEQIRAFGFGAPTGVDLPGESAGVLAPVEEWPRRAAAYISFGQAISVTGLQLASAVAAVANGGTLYRPFVVAAVGDPPGPGQARRSQPVGQPISGATARTLGRMMEQVVAKGTGRRAAVPGYRVAGKTGTAEKPIPGRGYVAGRYLANFVGWAPARDPALVILVAVDEPAPATGYHGGDVAAPVSGAVMEEALRYLRVPSDDPPSESLTVEARTASRRATAAPAGPSAPVGPPIAPPQQPAAEIAGVVPDLTGLTLRQAAVAAARRGLALAPRSTEGGFVVRQTPPPGTPAGQQAGAAAIEVWLAAQAPPVRPPVDAAPAAGR